MKCFYHSADLDGHSSGAVIKKFYPDAEPIGYNYGQDFPWDIIAADEVVFMVDVSLPIADMVKLARLQVAGGGRLIWIDHHIGIIRDFDALAEEDRLMFGGRRTDAKAACELCWEWCTESPMPRSIEALGIYDSWRFTPEQEPDIKAFQYGMRLEKETRPEKNMDLWEGLLRNVLDTEFDVIESRGRLIYDYQMTQNEKTARSCAFETDLPLGENCSSYTRKDLGELRCIAINSNLMNSDVFKSVYDPEVHDAMLCFYRSKRGFWRCSIYSDQAEVDCSVYAQSYGGGGHKGAAGFQWLESELPFGLDVADAREESNFILHAKREFLALGYAPIDKCEDDPNKWIQESVIELLSVFGRQGHSGSSAPFCIGYFEKLASFKPLSPLKFTDDEWNECGRGTFQNNRMSSVFKDAKDQKPYYLDAITLRTPDEACWHGSAQLPDGTKIGCSHYIDTSKTFEPKTFAIDVREEEVAKDDWEFYIDDIEVLNPVFECYERKVLG